MKHLARVTHTRAPSRERHAMHVFKSPPSNRKPARRPKAQSASSRSEQTREDVSRAGDALNGETSQILAALVALKRGNSDVRLTEEWPGQAGRIAEAFNEVVE